MVSRVVRGSHAECICAVEMKMYSQNQSGDGMPDPTSKSYRVKQGIRSKSTDLTCNVRVRVAGQLNCSETRRTRKKSTPVLPAHGPVICAFMR